MTAAAANWGLLDVVFGAAVALLGMALAVRHRRRGVGAHVTAVAITALLLAYGAVFRAELFWPPAQRIVEWTGWPDALRSLDDEIETMQELPSRTLDDLLRGLGWEVEEEPATLPEPNGTGLLEGSLVDYLVALVALGLRALALVTGSLSFWIALIWALASGRSTRLGRLAARVEALELAAAAGSRTTLDGPDEAGVATPHPR